MLEGDITASQGQPFDVIQFSISTSHTTWDPLWLPVLEMSNNWHSCSLSRLTFSLMCAHTLYIIISGELTPNEPYLPTETLHFAINLFVSIIGESTRFYSFSELLLLNDLQLNVCFNNGLTQKLMMHLCAENWEKTQAKANKSDFLFHSLHKETRNITSLSIRVEV